MANLYVTRNGAVAHQRILTNYVAWYPATLYARYTTGSDDNANHNPIDEPQKDDGTEDILNPKPKDISDNTDVDTPTGDGFTIYFSGNGHTNNAKDFEIRSIRGGYRLPYNDRFIKRYDDVIRYDTKSMDYISYDDVYIFEGWSLNKDATYRDKTGIDRCMIPGETLDSLTFLNQCLEQRPQNVTIKDENIIITEYAVWDRAPLLDAADKSWYYSEITSKTDDELKKEILKTVSVNDKEDTGGQYKKPSESGLQVEIVDFDRTAFDHLGEFGSVTVICKVTDGAGNTTKRPIRINVTNANSKNTTLDKTAGPLERSYRTYIRFIDKENYEKTKTVAGEVVPDTENGALEEDSIWYEDEEYRDAIVSALANIESGSSVVSYEYDVHDIAASKYYCKVNGTGNFKGRDNLKNWYQKFIITDGARVSGTLPE